MLIGKSGRHLLCLQGRVARDRSLGRACHRQSSSSRRRRRPEPSKSNHETVSSIVESIREEDWQWLPSMLARLLTAFGSVHLVSEYALDLTLCEGPSMLPTIRPKGEIILIDRLTPRIYGLEGGCEGKERTMEARKKQDEYEEKNSERQEDYTWHQTMAHADNVPPSGKWKRFWSRLTTGISVGDVVVVQHPQRHGTVCKRVLGLPGDMVLRPPPQPSATTWRQRAGRRRNRVQEPQRQTLLVVPDGHVWIEGDNTLNSTDSRSYGAVPAALVVGKVVCRVWPLRGQALLERGWRPTAPPGRSYSGSTVLPAGYEGEEIQWFESSDDKKSK